MTKNGLFAIVMAVGALCPTSFAQTSTFATASAGNWGPIVSPDSIAAGFGTNLTTQTYDALTVPLPLQLGGVGVQVTDSTKNTSAASLYFASQGQVNYLVPSGSAVGLASVSVSGNGNSKTSGSVLISNVSPAIFAANGNGSGVAAAEVFFYPSGGGSSYLPVFQGSGTYATSPFSLSPSSTAVYLVLYGTGIRHHSLNPVEATIGGTKVPVAYAGAASEPGLDQVNIGPLPQTLAGTGHGDVNVVVTVDGAPANTVTINIQ